MKRVWLWLGFVVLYAGVVHAQYPSITRPVGAGEVDLMSVPYLVDGGNTISNVFQSAAPNTTIYVWDTSIQVWQGCTKTSKGWTAGADKELLRGEGFFVQSWTDQQFFLSGGIPGSPAAIPVDSESMVLAYPFPVDVLWTNTELSKLLPACSTVSFWSRAEGSWARNYLKAPAAKGGGWGEEAAAYRIPAGDGFVVRQPPGSPAFLWIQTNIAWPN